MNIQAKREAVRDYVSKIVENDFYTVVFVKKTDGQVRVMNARQGVQKHSNGGVNPCAGKEDLLPTYSIDAKGYRTIWIDGIQEIRHGGKVVKFA